MMTFREVGRDESESFYEALAQMRADAYPISGVDTHEKVLAHARELREGEGNPLVRLIVADRDGRIVGAMKFYDFTMNLRGTDALTGGLGAVAVALDAKRQGIAREMVAWYLESYRSNGAAFAALHAFRPDFYRKLGFGYGTPMHRYRFATASLSTEGARGSARPLGPSDADALLACCERVRATTNGLIAKHHVSTRSVLETQKPRYIGIDDDGTIRAFMQTSVTIGEGGTANANVLNVRDIHAESDAALAALFSYVASQRDQFARVVIESQDDALFLATDDPRDGSDAIVAPPAAHRIADTGLGIMYRLLDIPKAIAHLARPLDAAFVLRLEVDDAFFAPTSGAWTFRFSNGSVAPMDVSGGHDAVLRIGVADLASLVVGSLGLKALVRYRRANIEPVDALATVAGLFGDVDPPRCETRF